MHGGCGVRGKRGSPCSCVVLRSGLQGGDGRGAAGWDSALCCLVPPSRAAQWLNGAELLLPVGSGGCRGGTVPGSGAGGCWGVQQRGGCSEWCAYVGMQGVCTEAWGRVLCLHNAMHAFAHKHACAWSCAACECVPACCTAHTGQCTGAQVHACTCMQLCCESTHALSARVCIQQCCVQAHRAVWVHVRLAALCMQCACPAGAAKVVTVG